MADLEVENTLREIRERVLADAQRRAPAAACEPAAAGGCVTHDGSARAGEALARMDANLATTERAWSRLPPLLTYRRGPAARLELWVKRLIKRAAHWFTWEQVNFNSAVHHALGDVRSVLAAHEQALAAHEQRLAAQEHRFATQEQTLAAHGQALAHAREELSAELRAGAEAAAARLSELQARLAHVEARFDAGAAQLRHALAAGLERLSQELSGLEAGRAEADEALREDVRAQIQARAGELRAEVRARAEELHAELRERVDGLLEEQRVCFKQLSLEAGEAAVMHDRARRLIEARLEALETKAAAGGE